MIQCWIAGCLVFSLSYYGSAAIAQESQTANEDAKRPTAAKQLRSPDVVYVPTPVEVVDAMLKVAKAGKGNVLFDLGSGDGRIPIMAVEKYGVTRAIGIEINPERIAEAEANRAKTGVRDRRLQAVRKRIAEKHKKDLALR